MFVDETWMRRRISVDFDLPVGVPAEGEPYLIPLTFLNKQPLVSFDLRDEVGNALPLLTHAQSDWLAWSAMVAAAEGILRADLPPELSMIFREIAELEVGPARDRLDDFREATNPAGIADLQADNGFMNLLEQFADTFVLFVPLSHVSVPARGGLSLRPSLN